MFCDLVDSTGIAARLDAEEWRYLVGAYFDVASAAVTEVGGHVAKKLGVLLGHRRKLLRSESGGLFADVRDIVFMDNTVKPPRPGAQRRVGL